MRKIKEHLIERMRTGDLLPLLNYIKTDNELRLEVRQKGEAFVYYRKGKALEIGSLKVDKKYGEVPPTSLAVNNPPQYFGLIKESIDKWLSCKKKRAEFDTQQNIAQCNQDKDDRYIIIDMEYAFEQNKIEKDHREKRAVFDLLGIERKTNKIIFFEVKKGMGSTKGKSGIEEHIDDFNNYLIMNKKHLEYFKDNLIKDIRNIIEDKIKLGLIQNFNFSEKFAQSDPELIFVFHPDDNAQATEFTNKLRDRHQLIIVGNNDYKLK